MDPVAINLETLARHRDPLGSIAHMHRPLQVAGVAVSSRCVECRRAWPCESHVIAHVALQRALAPGATHCGCGTPAR